MKIYDEFSSKVKSSASCESLSKFLDRICNKMEVRSIPEDPSIRNLIRSNDQEVLSVLREETQFCVLLMREIIEGNKEERERRIEA